MRRSVVVLSGLACALAFTAAGPAALRHRPPATSPTCPHEDLPTMARTIDQDIAVGWTRRWASTTSAVIDDRGTTWEPDALIAQGGQLRDDAAAAGPGSRRRVGAQCYTLPLPAAGTWIAVFGIAPVPGEQAAPFVLTTIGTAGVVRQQADPGRLTRVALIFPAAAGPARIGIEAAAGPPAITSVTITLARHETGPTVPVFADDFTGPELDDSAWVAETGSDRWGNRELQTYTAEPANVSVAAGALAITAHRRPGPDRTDTFTSARLNSRFAATYGHIEARIKPPAGAGLLPAFWMLGADSSRVRWPRCGEIDIMETLGHHEPQTVHAAIHGPDHLGNPWNHSGAHVADRPPAEDFHAYALDWWPNLVQMSFDGQPYASFAPEDLPPDQQWPFDKPFYLLLNVAVGGDWPGTPSPSQPFPQTMRVDSVTWWR